MPRLITLHEKACEDVLKPECPYQLVGRGKLVLLPGLTGRGFGGLDTVKSSLFSFRDLHIVYGIPAMTPLSVHYYLRVLGRKWQGKGLAVEVGSWLGATSVSLLAGLNGAGYNLPFDAYDRWRASAEEVAKARTCGLVRQFEEGQDLLPIYMNNVLAQYKQVVPHQQEIAADFSFGFDGPIEICILDAPKKNPEFSRVMDALHEHAIPGVTVVGLLDYYLYKRRPERTDFLAPIDYVLAHGERFVAMPSHFLDSTAAFFRYR